MIATRTARGIGEIGGSLARMYEDPGTASSAGRLGQAPWLIMRPFGLPVVPEV